MIDNFFDFLIRFSFSPRGRDPGLPLLQSPRSSPGIKRRILLADYTFINHSNRRHENGQEGKEEEKCSDFSFYLLSFLPSSIQLPPPLP